MLRLVACAAIIVAGTVSPRNSRAEQTVWLDDLDLGQATSGWKRPLINRSVGGGPLRIGGRTFQHGLGTHPPSRVALVLAGQTRRFTASVGIDDAVGNDDAATDRGSAEFQVLGDGKVLWKSGLMRGGDPAKPLDVELAGVDRLELIVTVAGRYSADHRDWADWVDAKFEITGSRPRAERWDVPFPPVDEHQARFDDLRGQIEQFRGVQQEQGEARRQMIASETFHPAALILPEDRDPADVVLRRTTALLEHVQQMVGTKDLSGERTELDRLRLQNEQTPIDDRAARRDLFVALLSLRRRIAFANPLLDFDRILFVKRHALPGHYSVGNNMCDQYFGFHAIAGGGLFVLEKSFSEKPTVRNVLADARCENGRFKGESLPPGGFLSPELSFDGQTILFAFTEAAPTRYQWTEASTFAVFRVGVDGTGLMQLTEGPTNDFDPCWLPNGRIAFISERRGGYGRCFGRPVPTFTLHTMNADGSDVVCLSPHETNEWQPSVDHFGRILYTRWDYVDRGDIQAHHPWVMTPDGRDARAIHGNYREAPDVLPCMEMDLRAIPGSARYVATAAPHHGQAYGSLVVIDPRVPDDDRMAPVRRLTPEIAFPQSEDGLPVFATAWPLDEFFHLCVFDAEATVAGGPRNNYGIYLIDAFGNRELIYRDAAVPCLSPIPLRPRPKPITMPHYSALGKPPPDDQVKTFRPMARLRDTAPVAVIDVREGLPEKDMPQITALRVIQVLPKTTPSADRPRIGYGSQKNARAVLGTVPVESDGSAYFHLPVGKPVYFQALDEDGRAVQSMRSDTFVPPGHGLVCHGCHEPRHRAPSVSQHYPAAMRRVPSAIEPEPSGSNPLSFPRLVQPVLDRHCAGCHNGREAKLDLRRGNFEADGNFWYRSYHALKPFAFYYGGKVFTAPRTAPGKFGARASRLLPILEAGHEGVELPTEDLRRITLWLDCNSDFFGSYENIEAQARSEEVVPTLE